jgi:ribosomal protein S18 acetylase RimI-like enzyme
MGTANVIRACKKEDLSRVARLHKKAFSFELSLLSQSSPRLIEKFYAECLDHCILIISEPNGKVTGVALGGAAEDLSRARRSFYWKNVLGCIAQGLSNAKLIVHALSNWRNLFLGTRLDPGDWLDVAFTLLVLAVSEDARGSGLALELSQAFEARLGTGRTYQIAVDKNNQAALRFYLKRGSRVAGEKGHSFLLVKTVP